MKRFVIRLVTTAIMICAIWGIVFANETKDPRKWTIDDVLKQEYAGDYDIHPDGTWVVWVKTRPEKEKNRRVGDIYVTSLEDSTEIQLTRGDVNDQNPRWSPDGKYIAFTSVRGENKDKKNQIWIINARGGEPRQLTKLEKGVRSFRWRDPKHIVFSAREEQYHYEKEQKKKKDDAIVVGDQEHFLPVRLFQTCVKGKTVKRLTQNSGKVREFAISPNGRWIVTNEAQNVHYSYDRRIPPRQFLYDLKEDTRQEIFTKERMNPYNYTWDLDGKGFYCSERISSDPDNDYVGVSTLYYFDIEDKKYEHVPLKWKWELGYADYYPTKEGLLTSLANGPWNKLAFYKKVNGQWERTWFKDKRVKNIYIHDVGKDGSTVVYTYTTASTPPKVKTATINNAKLHDKEGIIDINPWIKKKDIAKSEVVHWIGALGDTVDGILYYPHHYKQGKKYPLMASIHGGPSGVDRDAFGESWADYPNILASRGTFVLKVNYHGSGNYGLKWVESIKEHYYEYEVPDILSGIDYLIDKDMVDPDQLGIMGWSNGAILSIQCVVETDRFKVVAPGAGDVNWTSDYGNCAFGAAFDNAYFGGPPWERPDYYIKKSPLFKMKKVTTPTIIFFGTKDTNVPTEQGWEHYRALQQIGKAPVRFLLFPGEPHGLRKLSHQHRKMEEELAWFDRYLFNTYEKPNEAFKEDSPLAMALKKAKAKKYDGLFGEKVDQQIIPEVVELDSLWVGRFEVTRAQFSEFDSDAIVEPKTENYPVNYVSFQEVRDYCDWLSQKTGKTFRLPTEKEMEKLIEKAESNANHENNLDYWAGYSINPDEMKSLQNKIEELEQKVSLLKPVGSFKPIGRQAVYDLAGNVAEWCVTETGEGKIMGLSAVSPRDKKGSYEAPQLMYVGFRVVLEK